MQAGLTEDGGVSLLAKQRGKAAMAVERRTQLTAHIGVKSDLTLLASSVAIYPQFSADQMAQHGLGQHCRAILHAGGAPAPGSTLSRDSAGGTSPPPKAFPRGWPTIRVCAPGSFPEALARARRPGRPGTP